MVLWVRIRPARHRNALKVLQLAFLRQLKEKGAMKTMLPMNWSVLALLIGSCILMTSCGEDGEGPVPRIATFLIAPSAVPADTPTEVTWTWTYANTPSPAPICRIDQGVGQVARRNATLHW
jgi:hypothetical protein